MKKTLITILATVLVCCCAVGGTLAWLMDQTDSVVNTFTVGNVDIELTETGVDDNNAKSFKMVPGSTIAKDPKVTVNANSEACYVFVKIDESGNLDNFISYAVATGWIALDETNEPGVYYREVAAATANQEFAVLGADTTENKWAANQVYVNDTVKKSDMDDLTDAALPTLTFTAYAVQQSGFENNPAGAWTEAQKAENT